ncbi:unnamed protein product [Cyclocybe aegerita]|uniref:MYND-type domain-containing protein n=1 Tax=Cyclocybe aegerita TaxID=1973307 RepID=A0A8S0XXG3_CYCAE|nr:unnamed protein product [Cyclocybe aegerita]
MDHNYADTVLDLYDIALLLNYERASTEPRFRHAKLREVATTGDFKTVRLLTPAWTEAAAIPRVGFIFDKPLKPTHAEKDEPDLPTNMLPASPSVDLRKLTPTELETHYWQARNHDGCYRTMALLQHFIDLFPEFTRVRVRTVENNAPRSYTTLANERLIVEMKLASPRTLSMSCVLPVNTTCITGGEPTMDHAILGFSAPGSDIDTILDLSSLQFGDVGRGHKGRSLFVLEPVSQYLDRLSKYAEGHNYDQAKISMRINDAPDSEWLKEVAQRTKLRWHNRATDPWCGHCGAPGRGQPLKRCSKCQNAHYCNADHQQAAWTFHKHFCTEPKAKNLHSSKKASF